MSNSTPDGIIAGSTFSNKTVNMRIPLKTSAESVKNTDETGNKSFGFIKVKEHTKNYTSDSNKKAV